MEEEKEEKLEEIEELKEIKEETSEEKRKGEGENGKERWKEGESQKIVDSSRSIVWLSEIGKKDVAIAGGKGASLAEMYNQDLPVPPAFIVTAQAYLNFIEDTGIKKKIHKIVNEIDTENTQELNEKAQQIRKIILDSETPESLINEISDSYSHFSVDKSAFEEASSDVMRILTAAREAPFVAVRSSATTEDLATASFAGQQETFLNIKGSSALAEAVKRCWASLFTARAIYYRKRKGFAHEKSLIAVVVQKMVNSEKSGVAFTINPLTNNKKEIVIEAAFGLGEGIVSGAIEPDNYILDKESLRVKSKRLGKKKIYFTRDSEGNTVKLDLPKEVWEKEVLDAHELRNLGNYCLKIEEHYQWPQDIEWAIESGKTYIVQSRPVTTVKEKAEGEEEKEAEQEQEEVGEEILEGLAASSGIATGKVRIIHDFKDLHQVEKGDILVTRMTNPDMVVAMQKASAIVTDEGGLTSHAAIVSREVGIPCIVGTRQATQLLKDGQIITVDGKRGKVYEGKVEKEEIEETAKEEGEKKEEVEEIKEIPKIETKTESEPAEESEEKTRPLVKVNCDLPGVAERAAATGADGVGLIRVEFIIAEAGVHPAEYIRRQEQKKYTEVLVNGIEKIAKAFKDKPIWVRTSDIRTDEYRGLEGANNEPREDNPMIGWHGIRRGLDEPEILKAELQAIKQLHEKGYKNIGVMVPFLINVEELKNAKEIMNSIGLEPGKDIEFGVMIETPASCGIIDELCKEGIDFISFGTNDLTQLTLGIDRNNERLARHYNELHLGVLRQIAHVISVCRSNRVKTSICGQAGSIPAMARFLTEQGITSISANIDAVKLIREAVDDAFESDG